MMLSVQIATGIVMAVIFLFALVMACQAFEAWSRWHSWRLSLSRWWWKDT